MIGNRAGMEVTIRSDPVENKILPNSIIILGLISLIVAMSINAAVGGTRFDDTNFPTERQLILFFLIFLRSCVLICGTLVSIYKQQWRYLGISIGVAVILSLIFASIIGDPIQKAISDIFNPVYLVLYSFFLIFGIIGVFVPIMFLPEAIDISPILGSVGIIFNIIFLFIAATWVVKRIQLSVNKNNT